MNTTEMNNTEINTAEMNTTEINTAEMHTTEMNTTEMNTTEINTAEIQTAELNTTETNNYTECYYVYSNETLFVCTLTSSAGAGLTSFVAESGTATACFLSAVYVQNYTAICIVFKYRQIFFSSPTVRTSFDVKMFL